MDLHNRIKFLIRNFLEIYEMERYLYHITNIELIELESKNDFELQLTVHRPGIFIGKAGRTFNNLQSYLQSNNDENIKLKLIENTTW